MPGLTRAVSPPQDETLTPRVEKFTPRERDVLALLAQNLSDREIAGQLTLALSSVKWYTRQIYEKLGVENRRQAVARARGLGLVDSSAKSAPPPHNLPRQLTSFIGRYKEIRQVVEWVRKAPLVTLTGPGGVGKTRLALAAAGELLDDFRDGVWLVELAPLSNPELVPRTVMAALGLTEVSGKTPARALAEALAPRQLLLILDNVEHLLAACTELAAGLLRAAPGLEILATSRELLGVAGEIAYRVPPLTMPGSRRLPPIEALSQFDALRLFVERAQAASTDFALSEQNALDVAGVCARLDGIPLAIELAAARVRLLSVDQIASRLDQSFQLLTGGSRTALPRQQTLKAAIDWSYDLLSSQERLLLQWLSVFAGSWTLAGAEAVCAGDGIEPPEVLDLLGRLADKSLVQTIGSPDGMGRFRMLETVRQYAHDRLVENGGDDYLRDRHLGYYLRMGEQASAEIRGRLQLAWIARLENELDNLRLALGWALSADLDSGLRLATALMYFWHLHDRDAEGAQWLVRLLEIEAAGRAGQPLAVGNQSDAYLLICIQALNAYVFLSYFSPLSFPIDQAKTLLEDCVPLARALGGSASRELANGLLLSGFYVHLGPEESLAAYQECLEICQRCGYRFEEAHCLFHWGCIEPDRQKAAVLLETSLKTFRGIQDPDGIAAVLLNLSRALVSLGDYSAAKPLMAESLVYFRMVGNTGGVCSTLVSQYYLFPEPDTARQAEEALAYMRQHPLVDHMLDFCFLVQTEWSLGNYTRAESLACEALEAGSLAEGLFDRLYPHILLERIALSQGDLDKAREHIEDVVSSIKDDHEISHWFWGEPLGPIAVFLTSNGQWTQAATVFGAAEKKFGVEKTYNHIPQRMRREHDASIAAARAALGEEAFNQAWQSGQAMTFWQAFEYGRLSILEK